jgi:hypothetical protein
MNRPILLSCLLALSAPCLRAQDATPAAAPTPADQATPADGEVVLPDYEIAETREKERPEPWLYGQVAGFEILSCGTESQTRRLVAELQRFRIALGAVWPEAMRNAGAPVALIICGRGNTFAPFAPYHPDGRAASQTATTRFFNNREQAFLVIDVSSRSVWITDDENIRVAGDPEFSGELIVDHYQELVRSYIRYLVHRPIPPPPPWLAEGLTQLIGNVKYDRMGVTFGELGNGKVASGVQTPDMFAGRDSGDGAREATPPAEPDRARQDGDFTGRAGGLLLRPMDEFFAVQADSPVALNTVGGDWADQAHAFVHLCIYGENGRFQKGFMTFVARLQTEPLTEAMFKECFGMNYEKFGSFLRRYTASAWYKAQRFDLKKGKLPDPEPVELRDATPAEIARVRGDALLLARDEETAFLALVDTYRDGERDPALLASLGLVEARRGHADQAMLLLDAATRAKVTRPHAYTELARLRLAAAAADTAGTRLTKVQLASVLRPLFTARQIKPAIPDTYALIAEAWERSATPPTKDNLAVLLEGAALFPSDSVTLLRAARLHQSLGLLREAGALADLGATWAADPGRKQELLALKASLPAEAQVDLAKAAKPGNGKAAGDPKKKPPR